MPTQSRGFWNCDFCSQAFDTVDDALYHESNACADRPVEYLGSGSARLYPDETDQQQQPHRYVPHRPQHLEQPQPQHFAEAFDARSRLTPPRTLALIRPNEETELLAVDSVSLGHVELFEGDLSPGGLNRVVGLRCLQCGERPQPHPHHVQYPMRVEQMGNALRIMMRTHLVRCPLVSRALRDFLVEEGVSNLGNNGLPKLAEHCIRRCQELGVVNKYPRDTGIVFREEPLPLFTQATHNRAQAFPAHPFEMYQHEQMQRRQQSHQPQHQQIQQQTQQQHHLPGSAYMPQSLPQQNPVVPDHLRQSSLDNPSASQQPSLADKTGSPFRREQSPVQFTAAPVSANYPYSRSQNGEWLCKYCVNVRPEHRDPKYRWRGPEPPADAYVDAHFKRCQGYQQTIQPAPFYDQGNLFRSTFSQSYSQQQPGYVVAQPVPGSTSVTFNPPPDRRYINVGPSNMPPSPARLQRSQRSDGSVPAGPESDGDVAHEMAKQYLRDHDRSVLTIEGAPLPASEQLVLDDDQLLLTDYFFNAMKQLRKVQFTEADRKTRGGKRENITVGYGGLQCVHCVNQQNARKFFWSNVDRLANSFAEIPNHVRKCRHCPEPVKQALAKLHERHSKEMNQLPRGSQKIFFRRVWRRLHPDTDLEPEAEAKPPPLVVPSPMRRTTESKPEETVRTAESPGSKPPPAFAGPSPARTEGSDESVLMLERSAEEASKALASSTIQSGPPSPNSRVVLGIPDDKDWISETDSYVRRQIEVFCATLDDVQMAKDERKFPIQEGQVGIRCMYCAMSKQSPGAVKDAVKYPFSINAIYENVREIQRAHLDSCPNLPAAIKNKYQGLKGSSSLSSVLRNYYVNSAKALGLYDTKEGLRAGAERSTFSFNVAEAMQQEDSPKKRKSDVMPDSSEESSKKMAPSDSGK